MGASPDYTTERSGRCHKCNIRYIWPAKEGMLKDAYCPKCGERLRQTTHLFKGGPTVRQTPTMQTPTIRR